MELKSGHFYYVKDDYFNEFNDGRLMRNKEHVNGQPHDRPCFYAFQDSNTGLFWLIPFSSQTDKYRKYYDSKIKKYGKCDTIVFACVLGYEKAFLIQNMCPVTEDYIKNEYCDRFSTKPVKIDGRYEADIIAKAKKVLALQRKGIDLIFPDVLEIEKKLLSK